MRIRITLFLLAHCSFSVAGEPIPALCLKHKSEAVSVAFSPDGKLLVAGTGVGSFIFWDPSNGTEIRRIEGEHVGDAMAFSPDGKILATTRNWKHGPAGGIVHLWDVATGSHFRQIQGDAGPKHLTRCVAFSPDGTLLAAHSQFGNVRVWKVATGKELLQIATNSAGHAIAYSPDGQLLAFDVEYSIRICRTDTGSEIRNLIGHQEITNARGTASGHIQAITFSPDGKLLCSASCDNSARIWDVATGKTLHVLEGHQGFVNTIAIHRNGRTVLTGGEDGTIRLWEISSGKQLEMFRAHDRGTRQDSDQRTDVFAITISPDGKQFASGGRDTTVKVWEFADIFPSATRIVVPPCSGAAPVPRFLRLQRRWCRG